MTPRELRAARALILLLHEQCDRRPSLHPRRAALRTALACIEAVQAATQPEPARVAPGLLQAMQRTEATPQTVPGDFRPTQFAGRSVRGDTELATLYEVPARAAA